MTEMFQLSNARGEVVGINNYDLTSFTPTGLGIEFNNTYMQYDSYFKLSKTNINQGKFSVNIMFGDIESESYLTFSDFATFLSYQPLMMIYTTDIGTWYRDARLTSLTKTEIGGATVFATDKLNEAFSIEFINPWYNNKTGYYKTYDTDSNLAIYSKGFFNEIGDANRNYILKSSGEFGNDSWRPTISGTNNSIVNASTTYENSDIKLTYTGNGSQEWYYSLADAWSNMADTVLSFDNTYTISVDVMGTVPAVGFRVSNNWSDIKKINNTSWTRVSFTFQFPNLSGDNMSQFYIRLNALNGTDTNATGFTAGQTLLFRHFKLEIGSDSTPWITAPEDGTTDKNMLYTYGYMGVHLTDDDNRPFADVAEADETHLDN